MDSLNNIKIFSNHLHLDAHFNQYNIFSTRVTNALLRHGIITPRILIMHTQELLLKNIRNLGPKGLTEIEDLLKSQGWTFASSVDEKQVTLVSLLSRVFSKITHFLPLPALTLLISEYSHSTFTEEEITNAAAKHPYIEKTEGEQYRFHVRNIDVCSCESVEETHSAPLPELVAILEQTGDSEMREVDSEQYEIIEPIVVDNTVENNKILLSDLWKIWPSIVSLLSRIFSKITYSSPWIAPKLLISDYSHSTFAEEEIANAAKRPNIEKTENDQFCFHVQNIDVCNWNSVKEIHSAPLPELVSIQEHIDDSQLKEIDSAQNEMLEPTVVDDTTKNREILLSDLWSIWLSALNEQEQKVLFLYYGIQGDSPLTLQEVGEEVGLTRERVRQIRNRAVERLSRSVKFLHWQPINQLLTECIQQSNYILTQDQWEQYLDKKTIWESHEPRPLLLNVLCAASDRFHYLDHYQIATSTQITLDHLNEVNRILKSTLRQHLKTGLCAELLVAETLRQLPANIPSEIRQADFILRSIDLFDRISLGANEHYFYLRKKTKALFPTASSGWSGKPGSHLHDWELKLRQQFEKIAWIGQIRLTENDFMSMCQAIQEEAYAPNYFSKIIEGQPRLVPPAVFMTTMVLSARFAPQSQEDALDEFWNPYLHTVWDTDYTQAFYARCKKRFNAIVPFLEEKYGFEFPRSGKGHGDVVTPLFRHALIPRYMQSDFAKWLHKNWRNILSIADTPTMLVAYLRDDHSLVQYSHRLKHFITGATTAETAATLISNMAVAIGLHVIDGESIASISDKLAETPIKQELWYEIVQEFAQQKDDNSASPRMSKPRVTWIWSLDNAEMLLRVQNIILPADNNLEGEPDRIVWLTTVDADPLTADVEIEVSPWRMKTGERIIQEILIAEPDGSLTGCLALLTDMDEVAIRLEIPPYPKSDIQFFRPTQQEAYGVPVDFSQVGDGDWFVCSAESLTFFDEDNEIVEPDTRLIVPYPLAAKYQWAAQYTLSLPVTIRQVSKEIVALTQQHSQPESCTPLLVGAKPIIGLSRHIQPIFSDIAIKLMIEYGGERLLKQASLWIRGKDGWRWQRSLADLYQQGHATLSGDCLWVDLSQILPLCPNIYAVDLRISLQPIFPSPIQFAVVPGLSIELPLINQLFTPANPFALTLNGLDESIVVHSEHTSVNSIQDDSQVVSWHDLRNDPYLILRFAKVDIPLAWSISRFMTWLEPTPNKAFLTLDELRQTSLHAVSANSTIDSFFLFIAGQGERSFPLKRGRYSAPISQTQLYDMVRLAENPNAEINAQVGVQPWRLFEVRQRPQLTQVQVEYEQRQQTVLFHSELQHEWIGKGRFMVESLTNPFAPLTELAKFTRLQDLHLLPVMLPVGVYLLRVELDGAWLSLNENQVRFSVGEQSDELEQAQQLADEIRKGKIISPDLAEEFVLWWAEVAESEKTELTATTLFQLATIPAAVLDHFTAKHLEGLWATLAALKAVNDVPIWLEKYGLLPAWILLTSSVILKTTDHGFPLQVYPIQALQGGLRGSGYGRWYLTTFDGGPKESVYVQWRPLSAIQVIVEAGLPEHTPGNWSTIELEDTYALYHCSRCGRLTGARGSLTLPKEVIAAHCHGRETAELHDITQPEEQGGYRLFADFFFDRLGQSLTNVYDEFGIAYPSAAAYMPEPPLPAHNLLDQTATRGKFVALLREIFHYGTNSADTSTWACAARLLNHWSSDKSVSPLGQSALAFGLLIRSAAYSRRQFQKLCKDANLLEQDVKVLLAELNTTSAAHLQWGITWAELLFLHSRAQTREGNNE